MEEAPVQSTPAAAESESAPAAAADGDDSTPAPAAAGKQILHPKLVKSRNIAHGLLGKPCMGYLLEARLAAFPVSTFIRQHKTYPCYRREKKSHNIISVTTRSKIKNYRTRDRRKWRHGVGFPGGARGQYAEAPISCRGQLLRRLQEQDVQHNLRKRISTIYH